LDESKLLEAAEEVYDSWYADSQIDWEDFLDRLERYSDTDLGGDMLSPLIKKIKRHINLYRKLG
jgi:hypothetical protein